MLISEILHLRIFVNLHFYLRPIHFTFIFFKIFSIIDEILVRNLCI